MQYQVINVLVTGGCGFIGSNFIRYLLGHREDVAVTNLDSLTYAGSRSNLADVEAAHGNSRYRFVHGDICDSGLVSSLLNGSYAYGAATNPQSNPDIIVNFAAETHVDRSIDDSAPFIRTNIQGTQVLLEAARQQWCGGTNGRSDETTVGKRRVFLQISTDEVYGSLGEQGRFAEESPFRPNSPYAASKAGAELLARSYNETYGLPVIITRSSNNYGPFQVREKFIPLMISRAIENDSLPVYGNGQNIRDWIYVEDHCEAVALVIEHGTIGQAYNIGGDAERRNLEVAEQILEFMQKPKSLINFVPDRLGHDWRYALDSSRIQALGWKPRHPFDLGLESTIQWYVEKANHYAKSHHGSL